jgi:hypothetical protein
MTVWEILGGILTLVTLLGVFLKPILKLNSNITKLTCAVEGLKGVVDGNKKCLEELSCVLGDHETRITVLEDWRKGVE